MDIGYLSQDKAHLAALQRERRASLTRIDYTACKEAMAIMDAYRERGRLLPGERTNSAVLDAILKEWAKLAGIEIQQEQRPMRSPMSSVGATGINNHGARVYDSGIPAWLMLPTKPERPTCGATRHRDGQPCESRPEPGKARCRFHGGRSTGPKTEEGRQRALANLRQNSISNQRDGG